MKKLYIKPFIAVESFQLNAAIAGACSENGKYPINQHENNCTPFDVGLDDLNIGNMCKYDVTDNDLGHDNTVCYHTLENILNNYLSS